MGLNKLLEEYDELKKENKILIEKLIKQESRHYIAQDWLITTLGEINRAENYKYNKLILKNKLNNFPRMEQYSKTDSFLSEIERRLTGY